MQCCFCTLFQPPGKNSFHYGSIVNPICKVTLYDLVLLKPMVLMQPSTKKSVHEQAVLFELRRGIIRAVDAIIAKDSEARKTLTETAISSYRKALLLMTQDGPITEPRIHEKLTHLETLLRKLECSHQIDEQSAAVPYEARPARSQK